MDIAASIKVVAGTDGEPTGYWRSLPRKDILGDPMAYHSLGHYC